MPKFKAGQWITYDLGAKVEPRYINAQLVKQLSPARWIIESPEYGRCTGWADSILTKEPEVVHG